MQMQGNVRIQMFDKNTKKCVYDSGTRKNVVTNLYKNVMQDIVKAGLYSPFADGISSIYSQFTPQTFSNGILLLADPQIESVDTLYPRGKIVGYAGSNYSGTDYERGTLNTVETGPIAVGGVVIGYQWVWEWSSERANGTISAIGLCPRSIGNGQLMTPYVFTDSNGNLQTVRIANDYGYVVLTDGPEYYKQHKFGYIKAIQKGAGYFETLGQAKQEIEFELDGPWDFCSRPVLYKGKIWIISTFNDVNDEHIENGQYLLKITKDTTNIEQMWQLSSYYSLVNDNVPFGLTDTHMHYVYRPENDWLIRSFNLSTGTFEEIEPKASIGYTGGVSWFSSPTFAAVMGSNSMSTNPTNTSNYCDIIYPDQTVRKVPNVSGTYACVMPFGEKPYGIGYSAGYVCRFFAMLPCLFSVKNLDTPQTKDSTKTMKITYTLTW